ncbi:uncharacterized protein ANIA_11215 [Aspergillus nidulans FGSC A4]|uniref:Uncharacterized protein n=1 Tax=Emericella nidulans (strain FGSC A4 / ATCC 38163 / CBS 112.46 / NRRL 194 / M139) TaxID=227321 RepID=C8VQQ4_EMENI|nr:hypothetical protein [Aspergillus nidulans FGSC A4]CBF87362.1 TPA: conserved hypothetical protein [Aspergillus nidulans FGSC A4]
MRELAEKNARETRSMSIVSLISAIFLPAMFLATLFGTNFFDYVEGDLHIASNFWIYIVMALGMSGCTVLLWVAYQQRRKLKSKHMQKDIEACAEKGHRSCHPLALSSRSRLFLSHSFWKSSSCC